MVVLQLSFQHFCSLLGAYLILASISPGIKAEKCSKSYSIQRCDSFVITYYLLPNGILVPRNPIPPERLMDPPAEKQHEVDKAKGNHDASVEELEIPIGDHIQGSKAMNPAAAGSGRLSATENRLSSPSVAHETSTIIPNTRTTSKSSFDHPGKTTIVSSVTTTNFKFGEAESMSPTRGTSVSQTQVPAMTKFKRPHLRRHFAQPESTPMLSQITMSPPVAGTETSVSSKSKYTRPVRATFSMQTEMPLTMSKHMRPATLTYGAVDKKKTKYQRSATRTVSSNYDSGPIYRELGIWQENKPEKRSDAASGKSPHGPPFDSDQASPAMPAYSDADSDLCCSASQVCVGFEPLPDFSLCLNTQDHTFELSDGGHGSFRNLVVYYSNGTERSLRDYNEDFNWFTLDTTTPIRTSATQLTYTKSFNEDFNWFTLDTTTPIRTSATQLIYTKSINDLVEATSMERTVTVTRHTCIDCHDRSTTEDLVRMPKPTSPTKDSDIDSDKFVTTPIPAPTNVTYYNTTSTTITTTGLSGGSSRMLKGREWARSTFPIALYASLWVYSILISCFINLI